MDKAGDALFVNKHLSGHTPKLEQLYFLAIPLQDYMIRVRQAYKGQLVFREIFGELLGIFWANNQNGCVSLREQIDVLAQLRHVRAAEWSLESAVKYQQHILLFFEMRKTYQRAVKILHGKIWGY